MPQSNIFQKVLDNIMGVGIPPVWFLHSGKFYNMIFVLMFYIFPRFYYALSDLECSIEDNQATNYGILSHSSYAAKQANKENNDYLNVKLKLNLSQLHQPPGD